MVSAIIGLPGVGKSLLLGWIAHRYTARKNLNTRGLYISSRDGYEHLYTNFPHDGAYKFDFDTFGTCEYKDSLILCDEIQLFADSRNYKSFSDDLTDAFCQHRKGHNDFIYCTQDFSFVDKRIRAITDRIYVLDRTYFDLLRVRQVLGGVDLSTLGNKYYYSDVHRLFIPRFLYKYVDTDYRINDRERPAPPAIPWKSPPLLPDNTESKKTE